MAEEYDDFSDVTMEQLPAPIQDAIRIRTNRAVAKECGVFYEEYNLCLSLNRSFLTGRLWYCADLYDKMQQCCKNFDRTPIENMYKREFLLGRFWKTELDRNKDIAAVNKPK
eukprot:EG_transcript_32558